MTAEQIRARMDAAATPERIAVMKRFFKEPVDPRGISATDQKQIAKEVFQAIRKWAASERNALCTALWRDGKHEDGQMACYVYQRFKKQCGKTEFQLFESWIDSYVSNWAQCDALAPTMVAACVANDPSLLKPLAKWTKSKNRWKRRAAAVTLIHEAKFGRNLDFVFEIADLLLDDADEMVQKGVGWLLKEAYPQSPQECMQFLIPRLDRMPRLMVRYAAEKMSAADRATVMKRD